MNYKFTAKIKLDEPTINGTLYTKDSFKDCSYDVPIVYESMFSDSPVGNCHVDVEDNKLSLSGNVASDIFKLTDCTPTIYSIAKDVETNNDIKTIKRAQIKEVFFTLDNAFKDCEINWD